MSNEFYLTLQQSNSTDGVQEIYTDNELKYYTDTNTNLKENAITPSSTKNDNLYISEKR